MHWRENDILQTSKRERKKREKEKEREQQSWESCEFFWGKVRS